MAISNQIKKVTFTHEALILWMLENPHRSLRDAAAYFGYTQSWLSTIIHSDAFQEQLRKRQDELAIMTGHDIRAKLRAATDVALGGLTRSLETTEDPKFLLDATDKLLHRMGYAPASARNPGGPVQQTNIQNNITVSSDDLAAARALIGNQAQGILPSPATPGGFSEASLLPEDVDLMPDPSSL
ncbi:MAG TPA: hypothetical protein VFS89_04340, partial [Nitrosospira sp.]|nr:hypothetical protein [Nitrosospira sp.]